MQYQMFKNLKNDDVIQAGDEIVGGYINKWTSLEPGANAINYKASFYDKTSFRFRRKVDSAPKFKQHDTVKICNKDSKFFGVTGRIVGIRFEPLGFVYRIKYDVPQDVEQYKYSWYIESELDNIYYDPRNIKLGQRVRVNSLAPIFKGREGEIAKVDCKAFDYCVSFGDSSNGGPICFNENELDLIEETKLNFKVGQRVVISKQIWLPTQGDSHSGVIERTLGNGERLWDYVVRLDNGMNAPFKENEIELEVSFFEGLSKDLEEATKRLTKKINKLYWEQTPAYVPINLNLNVKYADLPVSKYRYLKIGEKIQKGDEYNSILCGWIPSLFVGGAVTSYDDKNNVYRRKTA